MSFSSLVNYIIRSPNHSGKRAHQIDTITIHCMAGNLSVESCGNWFAQKSAQSSSNYGIDSKGRIGGYVDEENRSWCTSSKANDNRAITIEVANTTGAPNWEIADAAWKALLDLCVDICRRNGIEKLLWVNDKSLIEKIELQNMTVHRWFQNKSCPGDWIFNHLGELATIVNNRLKEARDLNKAETVEIVNEQLQKENPLYADIKDVPTYWQPIIQRFLDMDVLNGGTPRDVNATDVNLHQDTVKAIVLLERYIEKRIAEGIAEALKTVQTPATIAAKKLEAKKS